MTTKTWPDSHPLKKTTYSHKNKWQQKHGHVFVVIYFCVCMWSFCLVVNLAMFLLSFIFVRVCGLFEWMWIWPCFCCHLFLWEYVVFLSGCESGHVFVVIYFCESMWSFWLVVNLAMFLLSFIFVRVCGLFEWMWIWPCFCSHLARFTSTQKDHVLSQK
jgi:hypothetical protein